MILSPLGLILIVIIFIFLGFKVLPEYERAVIFRWGRLAKGLVGGNGPGVVIIIPMVDRMVRVSLHGHDGCSSAGCHH